MKFKYYPERVKPQPIRTLSIDGFSLQPGVNEAKESLSETRAFSRLISDGAIELIEDPPAPAKKTSTIRKSTKKVVETDTLDLSDVES